MRIGLICILGFTLVATGVSAGCDSDDGGSDSGTPDTGSGDVGPLDTGAGDTGAGDTGAGDTGAGDTGANDTGAGDTGAGDTGANDTGAGDTGAGDTGAADTGDNGAPPVITTIAWDQVEGCAGGSASDVTITITATDDDTATENLTYSGSVTSCTGSLDSATPAVSCPQVGTYTGTVTVSDDSTPPNTDTESFSFGVCESGSMSF